MQKKLFSLLIAAGIVMGPAHAEESDTELFKKFISHCVECSAENPLDKNMEGSMFNWVFEGDYKVVYADKKIFSYYAEELVYTGGAHGSFTVKVGSMYRITGRKIKIKDLAPTALQKNKLLELIIAQTAKKFKCTVKDLPTKLLNMPTLTENFYLNTQGITFVYNEYEIASKGAGAIKIVIPYAAFPVNLK